MMNTRLLMLFFFTCSGFYAKAQQISYDKLFNAAVSQKDTLAALEHLSSKLEHSDPAKSGALELLGTNNQVFEWLFRFSANRKQLKTAARYMERLIALKPESYQGDQGTQANFTDTYANLLHKLGKRRAALHWEEKALENAYDHQKEEFGNNLEKIKKGQATW